MHRTTERHFGMTEHCQLEFALAYKGLIQYRVYLKVFGCLYFQFDQETILRHPNIRWKGSCSSNISFVPAMEVTSQFLYRLPEKHIL